jgi:hypothetical protein
VARSGRAGLPREVRVAFWDGVRASLGVAAAGVSKNQGWQWLRDAGGVKANGLVAGSGRLPQGREERRGRIAGW